MKKIMEILFNLHRKLVILMKFIFYVSAYLFVCLKISNFNAFTIKLLLKISKCYKKLLKYCKIHKELFEIILEILDLQYTDFAKFYP